MSKLFGSHRTTSPNPVSGAWRKAEKRCGDSDVLEDVPSDESDDDRRTPIKRPRLRQRPKPNQNNTKTRRESGGVMSPFQERMIVLTQTFTLSRRQSSSNIIGETSVKNPEVPAAAAEPESITPRQADPLTPVRGCSPEREPIAGYSGGVSVRQVRRNILAEPNLRRTTIKSVKSVHDENGWTLLSLWVPSWKAKLQCDNESLAAGPKDLGKEVLEVLETVVPFIAHYKQHELKLFKVQNMQEDGSGSATIELKQYLASLPDTGSISFKSSDVAMVKLIAKIVSADDIILQFKPIPSETQIPGVIIHLTARNSNDGIFRNHRCSVTFQNFHVNIHDSPNLPYPYDWETILEIRSKRFRWPGHGDSRNEETKKRAYVPLRERVFTQQTNRFGGSSSDAMLIDLVDDSDSDDEPVATSNREGDRNFEFNLDQFPRESVFLPGPMRPKLVKGIANYYVYHRLGEMAELLSDSLATDSKTSERKVICGLVKHQCHAYGIVVKVVKEHRHSGTAYLIRIADETMDSVLLRLHTGNSRFGPVIEVGDIIRIHRLTVQIEWDSEHDGNTMVLSTSQHFNYVIFRESADAENNFNYQTCAKNITLGTYDKMRVEQLSQLKKKNAREAEVEELPPNDLPQAPQNHSLGKELVVTNDPANANSDEETNSDGICSDDLVSPRVSDASMDNCSFQQSPELFSDAQINPRVSSCTDSDDSYVTAIASPPNMELQNVDQTGVDKAPDLISPDLEETLQSGASLHLGRQISQVEDGYTRFMNLKKNGSKPTLLCTLDGLSAISEKNMCHLIIKDGEATLPVEDFKNKKFLGNEREDSHLVLNITNAKKLVERGIFSQLFDSLGANELYIIEDVEIQGENPPYSLEVNGDTCVIRLATDKDLLRDSSQPFTLQSIMNETQNGTISGSENRNESALNDSVTKNNDSLSVQTRKQIARKRTGGTPREKVNGEARSSSRASSRDGASATPGSSPGTSRNDKLCDDKVTTRRMRRHHNQSKDTL